MSTSKEAVDVEKYEFEWGKKRSVGGKNKVAQFYNSFTYDGIEYSLYDSVFLYKDGEPEPYIGKLVKIWEQEHKRKVKVLWFFRPIDIEDWLGDHETLKNELFLASGDGIGLANINPLEAIAGKCNVVCTLKDKRNPQPSAKDIENADYIFYRTFDVLNHTISDTIDGNIAGIEVKFLFNKIVQISADIPRLDAVGKEETESVVAGKDKKKEKPKSSPNLVTEDNNTPFTNLMLDETVKPRLASDGNNVKTSSESVVAGKDEKKVKPKSSTNSVVLDNNSSKELKLDDSLKPRLDSDGNVKTSSESVIAAKDEKKVKPKSSASSVAVDNKPDNSVNPRLESDGNDVKTSSESVVASNDLKGKASKEIFKSVSSKDKSLKVSSANQGNDSLPGKKIVPGTRTMSRETETALVKPEHVLNKKSIPIADSDKYEGRMAKRVLGKNENREKQESSTDLVELDNRPSKKPKLGSSVKERLDSDQNDVKEASSGSKSEENSKSKLLKVSSATTVKSIAGKDEKKDKLKSSANLVAVDNNKSSEKLKLDNSDGNDVKALSGSASEDKVKPKLVKDSLGKDKGPFNKVKPAGRTGKILNGSMSKAVPAPEKKIKPEEEPVSSTLCLIVFCKIEEVGYDLFIKLENKIANSEKIPLER
ncbi:hypothetical protein GIB67_025894 [Kingdonia uniflora]|uniref:BAH domain-containing protein n=1 Tax=Kingdonia uniflora TaxID=39325 RepID=A0A7J7LPR4_9MAGN|nr:hypothetical protein GIB67_025894 [Kingdonia uniflora]